MVNKETFCLDVFGTFRARNISILCQGESAHVVLVYNICLNLVALSFKKVTHPKNVAGLVVETNDLTLS